MENKINEWKTKGYTIIKGAIDNNLLKECENFMKKKYNTIEKCCTDFGSNGELEFPSNTILDKLSIHEGIIKIVQQLLSTEKISLIQSDAWSKAGIENNNAQSNQSQRIHMDYGNNMFLHPSNWENPEAVSAIIYFSDTKKTEGATSLVPKNDITKHLYKKPYINMPGQANLPFINNKEKAEEYFYNNDKEIYEYRKELYNNEIQPHFEVGDILFYRLDLWHRGNKVKKGEIRNVMNLAWKKSECYWINNWNPGWTRKMYYGFLEKMFISMSPLQRSVLGVPLPGEKYWTKEKLELLKLRYPTINISLYC